MKAWRRLALGAAALLIATVAHAQAAVVGSGRVQTEVRAIGGFEAVTLLGSMKLVLRQGQRQRVEIRADDNLLPLIDTRVISSAGLATLQISGKPGASYSTRNEITVTVDLISLKALTLGGSGDAFCDGLKTPALNLALSGSGNLKLAQLDTEALALRVSGSGDAQLSGRAARFDAAVSGSGDVTYAGSAAVTRSITGSGSLKKC